MSRCTSHKPIAKASRYGADHCRFCTIAIVPEPCIRCDGTGEIFAKATGWHDCPDCEDGVAKWESEQKLKELDFDDL